MGITITQCDSDTRPIQCDPVVVRIPEREQCGSDPDELKVCNWNNSITEPSDCGSEEMCLYCFNSSHCVPLPAATQQECENTPICVLFGGEVLWDLSEVWTSLNIYYFGIQKDRL